MSRIRRFVGATAVFALVAAAPAVGDTIEIISNGGASTQGIGSFAGSIAYEADLFSTTGLLTITLENTSDPDNGGYLTAFLFNIGGEDPDATASLLDAPEPFQEVSSDAGRNGAPYGSPYDTGAGLHGKFLAGGSPVEGLQPGEGGVFTFEIDASDAGELTAMDFLDGGPFDYNFIVRFRGFEDGGSDKVPGQLIPLPAPLGLGLLGLALVAGVRRRTFSR